ncbi:MAG: transporter substrate-binding domain-containing protein [Coriobacteriia bacterium]|nr:transporter substrate-binding domain-containing protein [Coriobacteriia bacterium]
MTRRITIVIALAAVVALLAGCVGAIEGATLTPKVAPPVIRDKGVLRVAADLQYPPFGGIVDGEKVGLDVDVASALAERLGLKVQLTDAKPEMAAKLVEAGDADVAIGALPVDQVVASGLAFAGTYASDAPALFSSSEATASLASVAGKRIAVQKDSYAYWALIDEYGEDAVIVMPSLREALTAAAGGQADYAAGDAVVGSYLLRDFPALRFNGQLVPAYPLGVAVSKENTQLEQRVRAALDQLAAKGVLETLRAKWTDGMPRLEVPRSLDTTETPPAP